MHCFGAVTFEIKLNVYFGEVGDHKFHLDTRCKMGFIEKNMYMNRLLLYKVSNIMLLDCVFLITAITNCTQ